MTGHVSVAAWPPGRTCDGSASLFRTSTGSISTRAPQPELELLIAARPDVYFLTPHYEGWDAVLVRLDIVDDEELAGRIEDAWAFVDAKRPRKKN
jgi:hypothetical protein